MAMLCMCATLRAQEFRIPAVQDSLSWKTQMPQLAGTILARHLLSDPNDLFILQLLAGHFNESKETLNKIRALAAAKKIPLPEVLQLQYELYAAAYVQQQKTHKAFTGTFGGLMDKRLQQLSDSAALQASAVFAAMNSVSDQKELFKSLLVKERVPVNEAVAICKNYLAWKVNKQVNVIAKAMLEKDDNRRYVIEDSVLIKTKGGFTLSAIVARKKNLALPQPAALFFFIYTNTDRCLYEARRAAIRGYVGVVADTRGKRLSTDSIRPYECEVDDVNEVIDWISHQSWNNGKVGMYGGSYSGFAQWAALKHPHPALKTIVPYVAAIPGMGLPMENNIFLNANYGWPFYVTNNRYLDNKVYFDPQRWRNMQRRWFSSGVAYRSIDSVDGTPNPSLQQWLKHPAYDNYWQAMVPYKEEYAGINIPVLSVTGYYDDGQLSALHYLREHVQYNKDAEHYLVIGPWDHLGAQRGGTPVLHDYKVDDSALINIPDITFQWLDYILKGGPKPAILKDKINYEVMGANKWLHAPSLEKMSDASQSFYLTNIAAGSKYLLSTQKPADTGSLQQEVDLANRNIWNNDYYPDPIMKQLPENSTGMFFISEAFDKPVVLSGSFSGVLKASINKRDMDIGVTLYEVMPDGRLFHLSYFLGRASYADDPASRKLLTPGAITTITFSNTRLVSKQLAKGSRLLVMLDINKNPFAQVNYGTGKDISDETIADAGEPLRIRWYNDSFVSIPLSR
ncbi:MAG: CocE/NonD family hydrolase [Chitinophagaceae bacterium]